MSEHNLFDEWSSLNKVLCDFRGRFDRVRDGFAKCSSREEAEALLRVEGFAERYPLLPDWLPPHEKDKEEKP